MPLFIDPQDTFGDAWFQTLRAVHGAGGRAVHVLTTVTDPRASDNPKIRAVADQYLYDRKIRDHHVQSIDTVANTIFPSAYYKDPQLTWSPGIKNAPEGARIDSAATRLYSMYVRNLPSLKTFPGSSRGTYFSRLIDWPNGKGAHYNQLAARIKTLRGQLDRKTPNSRFNATDMVLAAEAEENVSAFGAQVYSSSDETIRGFPCLVHVDVSVLENRLSLIGTYRHQYLVTKAYGNLIGLARLQAFLAQQTGFEIGELSMMATYADAEEKIWTHDERVDKILLATERAVTV